MRNVLSLLLQDRTLVKSSPQKVAFSNGKDLDVFHKDSSFTSYCQSQKMLFFNFQWENIMGFLGIKCDLLTHACSFQEFLILSLVHSQPPTIYQNYNISFPTNLLFQHFLLQLADLIVDSLNLTASPDFGVHFIIFELNFLMNPPNLWFGGCSPFSLCKDRNANFETLNFKSEA